MKKVTISLTDDLARLARIEAAKQDKSLSRFIADLLKREFGRDQKSDLEAMEEFLSGPGYPGISKLWQGREALYAEREAELLRRYECRRS